MNEELSIPLSEIELRASRSSGPGGQHANVTASRVEAVFNIAASQVLSTPQRELLMRGLGSVATAVAQDARGQARNRELALERLAKKLDDALVVRPERRPTRPGRAAKKRRLEDKRRQSQRKAQRRRPGPDE